MKGAKTIQRSGRWLRSRWQRRGLILLYHRIADTPADPYQICVSPANFTAQMDVLSRNYTSLPLEAMVKAAETGTLPPRAISVTFDDGYADNLTEAQPVLERKRIPATIFVVTGALNRRFWWEQLKQVIHEPESLPANLSLIINDRSYSWKSQDTTAGRRRLLRDLHRLLRPLNRSARAPILIELQRWAGISMSSDTKARPLTEAELRELANSDYTTIGAHTHNHPVLALLSPAQQEAEIGRSKARLEALVGRPVTAFSYPFGTSSDYSPETIRLVSQAAFNCACTNVMDVVQASSDCFQLPRYWVGDWNGDEFSRRLGRWL